MARAVMLHGCPTCSSLVVIQRTSLEPWQRPMSHETPASPTAPGLELMRILPFQAILP